jgi:hypothetical protein
VAKLRDKRLEQRGAFRFIRRQTGAQIFFGGFDGHLRGEFAQLLARDALAGLDFKLRAALDAFDLALAGFSLALSLGLLFVDALSTQAGDFLIEVRDVIFDLAYLALGFGFRRGRFANRATDFGAAAAEIWAAVTR